MEREEKKLNPCPFCGSEADEDFDFVGKEETVVYFCLCENCLARGSLEQDKEQAIKAWNKRTATPIKDSIPVDICPKCKNEMKVVGNTTKSYCCFICDPIKEGGEDDKPREE